MPERKKVVVMKVLVHDNKDKNKAMKAVSTLSGMEQMKDKKWHPEIVTFIGPVKEEKKKKPENKKHEGIYCIQPLEDKKTEEEKKKLEATRRWMALHRPNNPYMRQQYYAHNLEDYPNNGCVIC